jgi:hypothetical protein
MIFHYFGEYSLPVGAPGLLISASRRRAVAQGWVVMPSWRDVFSFATFTEQQIAALPAPEPGFTLRVHAPNGVLTPIYDAVPLPAVDPVELIYALTPPAEPASGQGLVPGVTYPVGHEWTEGGQTWEVYRAFRNDGWPKEALAAHVRLKQAGPGDAALPWVQPAGAHDAYAMGALVTHNGRRWENTGSAANVWAPGVFGWTDLGPL